MGKQLTIRGLSDELEQRLEGLSQARGQSLDATVVEILEKSTGVEHRRRQLERWATWTDEDLIDFQDALASQRTIDDKAWH